MKQGPLFQEPEHVLVLDKNRQWLLGGLRNNNILLLLRPFDTETRRRRQIRAQLGVFALCIERRLALQARVHRDLA